MGDTKRASKRDEIRVLLDSTNMTVLQVARHLNTAPQNVYKHLKALRSSGWTWHKDRKDGAA